MKILFIHTKYKQSLGGEDTAVQAESDLMRAKGHQVRTLLFDNASVATGVSGKLKAGMSAIYNRSSARKVTNVLKDFQPDVVHVHNFFFAASPSILIAVHKSGIPLVATLHNYRLICTNSLLLRNNHVCELCVNLDFAWYGVKYRCYHNSAIQSAMVAGMAAVHKWNGTWKKKVDMYITPAEFSRNRLMNSSLNLSPDHIKVKRNFVDDPGYSKADERQDYFLFVGRLAAEKGVDVLLKAWRDIGQFRLIVAGDGPELNRLSREYADLKNVTFAGKQQRNEVIELMKSCRALVFPSIWYEGLPMTIVEAFATGTPVIASNLGAMSEMIEDGTNGLLFAAGEADALKNAIKLLASPNASLYENARKSYLELYHPDKCYEEVMQIYEHVIASKAVH